jgi:hypothetical protein
MAINSAKRDLIVRVCVTRSGIFCFILMNQSELLFLMSQSDYLRLRNIVRNGSSGSVPSCCSINVTQALFIRKLFGYFV